MTACTYCGCEVEDHDPVYVDEHRDGELSGESRATGGAGDGERVTTGRFCNYGCLVAHVEAERLAVGTACQWEPE